MQTRPQSWLSVAVVAAFLATLAVIRPDPIRVAQADPWGLTLNQID